MKMWYMEIGNHRVLSWPGVSRWTVSWGSLLLV